MKTEDIIKVLLKESNKKNIIKKLKELNKESRFDK